MVSKDTFLLIFILLILNKKLVEHGKNRYIYENRYWYYMFVINKEKKGFLVEEFDEPLLDSILEYLCTK